jgi:hypothetical protein
MSLRFCRIAMQSLIRLLTEVHGLSQLTHIAINVCQVKLCERDTQVIPPVLARISRIHRTPLRQRPLTLLAACA